MTCFAHAGTITPDASGKITVSAGTYADTILASGGCSVSSTVDVLYGATVHGDAVLLDAVAVSVAGYTIDNAGRLNSTFGRGIDSSFDTTVNNYGTISGGSHGISVTGNTFVSNKGIITGDTNADGFGNGLEITGNLHLSNYGKITSLKGLFAVNATGKGSSVINYSHNPANDGYHKIAMIYGGANGVIVGSNSTVSNSSENFVAISTITGGDDGVITGASSTVSNSSYVGSISTISGGIDGVTVGAGSTVSNSSIYSSTSTISGGTDGVIAGAGSTVSNSGNSHSIATISGGIHGVIAGTGSTVSNFGANHGTATISGGIDGVIAGAGSTLRNSSFSGTAAIIGGTDGVTVGANSYVYNGASSWITANTGNGITAANNTFLPLVNKGIVNYGTIAGGTNGVFAGDFVRALNSGTIRGISNIGVRGGAGSTVRNSSFSGTATIFGGTAGVIAGATSTVINGGDDNNHGTSTITGGIYGVIAGASSTVINDGYTGNARITGGTDGVTVGADSNVYNYYASSIVGTAGNGIAAADNTVLPAVDYGIVNDEGTITGGANGVFAGALARVFNEGIIAGTSNIGVLGGAGSMVHNFSEGISDISSLSGGRDGAVIGKDSWVVNESNYGTATITGGAAGVIAGAGSTIINFSDNYENPLNSGGGYAASTITGDTAGVITGEGSTVTNFSDHDGVSVITGGATGVIAGAGSTVMNDGYSGTSTITGGIDGMSIGADSDVYNVRGKITGTTGNGITTADNTALPTIGNGIKNLGTIAGGTNGVFAGDFARVYNGGGITGTSNIGVHTGSNSVVNNYGTITGTVGVGAFGTGGTFNLNNNGGVITGTGGVAIAGLPSGVNTFRLSASPGSIINGDIHGGLDFDTLILNGGRTSVYGTTNVVHGDVTSIQDIIKNGTGTAFLGAPGDPLFTIQTDAIHITGGGLFINGNVGGDLVAKTVIHAGGATLGGTGVWDAEVNLNAGDFSAGSILRDLTLSPATEAIGQVELHGDLNVAAGSFIRFDVDTQAAILNGVNSDLIVQTGVGNTTSFASGAGLFFAPLDTNKIITDGTYTVIDSAEPIMGTLPSLTAQESHVDYFGPFFNEGAGFDTGTAVMFSEFTTVGLADGGTDLVITVKHDFERLARTPNQAALGAAIDASVDSGDSLIQDFILAMDHSDLFTVQQTLADLTPEPILGLADSIVNSNYRLHRQVQDHLATTRSPGAVMTKTGQTDLWGAASYDWQDFEEEFGTDDFDHEVGSFTAGIDYRVTDKLLLGLVLDGSIGHSDGEGFDTDIESLRGAIYGTWGGSTGLYVDALAGYGTHDIDADRELGRMGGILYGDASSSTDAESLQAMLTAGYAIGNERVKHGPFAGLEYQNLEVDGFTQESILPIDFDDFDIDSLRGLIGYRVDAKLSIFRPYASVAYAHEFGGDRANATAFFGDESFKVSGSERDSSILVTAGTGISLMNSLTLDLGYRGDISMEDEGLSSHGATAGVNWIF